MSTVKISALNPLVSGSTCEASVLPIVNNGVTEKISIDNLRGTLRGASNQGPANAALNGGINNAACRLGDSTLGGQNNIVNANFCAQTSNSSYDYEGPIVTSSGSLSTVIGGLYNKIDVKSIRNNSGYAITPDMVLSAVSSCITGSATSAYNGYYGIVGGNTILGGHSQRISGPTANGNYSIGHSMILGGYSNTISSEVSTLDGASATYNNAIINGWSSKICRLPGGEENYLSSNTIIGGDDCIVMDQGGSSVTGNNIIGYSHTMVNPNNSSIIGGSDSCLTGGRYNAIMGGNNHCISGSTLSRSNSIVGGCNNKILVDINAAVVLGGTGVTGSVANAVHMQKLVFKTGADGIPTADPTHAGQVWNDAGILKISAG